MDNEYEKNGINNDEINNKMSDNVGGNASNGVQDSEAFKEVKSESEKITGGEEKGDEIKAEELGAEAESNRAEEASDDQKEKNSQRQGGQSGAANGRDEQIGSSQYSTSYVPPYYASSASSFAEAERSSAKKSGKGIGIGAVALICAVCTVIAAVVGGFVGHYVDGNFSLFGSADNSLTVLKGNKEIVVTEVDADSQYSNLSTAQVAALVGDSVVEITTTQVQTNAYYGQYITSGAGSGVIFSQDSTHGYIVTNYHVIAGAKTVSVRVNDGDSYVDYDAEFIAGDSAEDIAVIKIQKKKDEAFVVAKFGDSDKLSVGEQVVAIGNPLGQLGGTVTDGIISALDREITVGGNTMTLLQTNAAINPGNSGGGLFDTSGLLIGIVNAKQSSTGIEGLGFAIPSNNVLADIEDIMELGYVSGRPTIGVSVSERQDIWGQTFVCIEAVQEGSPFKQYDCIVAVGDTEIKTLSAYNNALKKLKIGETVTIRVIRNQSYVNVSVTVTENRSAT